MLAPLNQFATLHLLSSYRNSMWVLVARIIRKRTKARREERDQAQASNTFKCLSASDGGPNKLSLGPQCKPNTVQKEADGQAGQHCTSPARSTFWFKVRLLAALLLPVSLETLDYTRPCLGSTYDAYRDTQIPLVVATAQTLW